MISLASRNTFSLQSGRFTLRQISWNRPSRGSLACIRKGPLSSFILFAPEMNRETSAPCPKLPCGCTLPSRSWHDSSRRPLRSISSLLNALGSMPLRAACASCPVHCSNNSFLRLTSSPASTRLGARQEGREVSSVAACEATGSHLLDMIMSENTLMPIREEGGPTIVKVLVLASTISPASVLSHLKYFSMHVKA